MPWRLEQYISICTCVLYFLKQESTGQNKCIEHWSQLRNCQQLVFFNRHSVFSVTMRPWDYSASQQIAVQLICKFPRAPGRLAVHGTATRMENALNAWVHLQPSGVPPLLHYFQCLCSLLLINLREIRFGPLSENWRSSILWQLEGLQTK